MNIIQDAILTCMRESMEASTPEQMVLYCARMQALHLIVLSIFIRPEFRSLGTLTRETAASALELLDEYPSPSH